MAVQISGNDITVPRDTTVTRNLTVGGVLTYEDVTNVDSIGIVTARAGVLVGSGITLSKDGDIFATGVTTSTTFVGNLTGNVTGNISGGTVAGSTGTFTGDVDIADKIVHTGDTDTLIRFPSANNIQFDVAGVERLRVDNSDGVIAKHTTAANLRIQNSTAASSQTATLDMAPANGVSGVQLKCTSEEDFSTGANRTAFFTVDIRKDGTFSERLRIDSSGHMGLGVTPNSNWPSNNDFKALQIGTGACVFGRGSGDDDRAGLAANYYATGSGNAYLANGHANLIYLNDGNIDFHTAAQNSSGAGAAMTLTQILRMNTSGNIKIGNNSDRDLGGLSVQRLHIEGTDGGTSAIGLVNNQNSSGQAAIYFSKSRGTSVGSNTILQDGDPFGALVFCGADGNDMISVGAQISASVEGSPGSNDMPGKLVFSTTADGAASPTERMRMLPDGQIFTNGLDGSVDITVTGTGDTYDGMQIGKPPFRVTRTSNVPAYLNRNGSGGNIIQFRYGGSVVGSISDNSNSLPSDRNYKKDITNLTLGLDLVNKLQPVSYHYKFHEDTSPVMYGLIAQDVETALNDAGVAQNKASILQYEEKNDEKDSDYSLDYIKFTPILINAVKELSAEIESLKSEIAALKSS